MARVYLSVTNNNEVQDDNFYINNPEIGDDNMNENKMKISVGKEITKQIKQFEPVKVFVSIETPCDKDKVKVAVNWCEKVIDEATDRMIQKALGDKPAHEAQAVSAPQPAASPVPAPQAAAPVPQPVITPAK